MPDAQEEIDRLVREVDVEAESARRAIDQVAEMSLAGEPHEAADEELARKGVLGVGGDAIIRPARRAALRAV